MKGSLRVEGLSFSIGRPPVCSFNDIALSVKSGEMLLLVGESGSGKSSFLDLIRGVRTDGLELNRGSIKLGGMDITEGGVASVATRGVGWVGQNPEHNLHQLRVMEELESGPQYAGMHPDRTREVALQVADYLELTSLLNRNPETLSGGQKQIVAIGAALSLIRATVAHSGAQLMLLDEPDSYLDARNRVHLMGALQKAQEAGVALIIATHRPERFEALASGGAIVSAPTIRVCTTKALSTTLATDVASSAAVVSLFQGRGESRTEREVRIEAANVTHRFDEQVVLDNISLSLDDRRLTTIVGGNGSGKSTLGKILAGVINPTSGQVLTIPTGDRRGYYVPQIPESFFFSDSVEGELMLCFRLHDQTPNGFEVQKSLQRTRLRERSSIAPEYLSGGEQRILNIELCLVSGPPAHLLVLDEPEFGLDRSRWQQVSTMLRELARRPGIVVVILSHDADLAALGDRVVGLHDGGIIFDGTPEELQALDDFILRDKLRIDPLPRSRHA